MDAACAQTDCTVAETGKCLLNNDPSTCEHRTGLAPVQVDLRAPLLPTPEARPNLRPSLALGTDDIGRIFNRSHCVMVGILGLPGAGKTAALVSLYLQLANHELRHFDYRHSESLAAFEQLSRGLREWKLDAMPQQLTTHTEIADGRSPAFLHLRVFEERKGRTIDLLLPDLPGEWTSDLANLNRCDRFGFLASCAHIWLFVDGRKLASVDTRNVTLRALDVTTRRVWAMLGDNTPPITIVSTWADVAVVEDAWFQETLARAAAAGRKLSVSKVASFSDSDAVQPGAGIAELVDGLLVERTDDAAGFVPSRKAGRRAVLNYRG